MPGKLWQVYITYSFAKAKVWNHGRWVLYKLFQGRCEPAQIGYQNWTKVMILLKYNWNKQWILWTYCIMDEVCDSERYRWPWTLYIREKFITGWIMTSPKLHRWSAPLVNLPLYIMSISKHCAKLRQNYIQLRI